MVMSTSSAVTISLPLEDLRARTVEGIKSMKSDLQKQQAEAKKFGDKLVARALHINEEYLDRYKHEIKFQISFISRAFVANTLTFRPIDDITCQMQWNVDITFSRGLRGWLIKRGLTLVLKRFMKKTLPEVVEEFVQSFAKEMESGKKVEQ